MSTMADAEDALLQGKAQFMEWIEEFVRQWHGPLTDTLVGASWAGIDPQTKQALSGMVPGAVETMNKNFGGRNGNIPMVTDQNNQQQLGAGPVPLPGLLGKQ